MLGGGLSGEALGRDQAVSYLFPLRGAGRQAGPLRRPGRPRVHLHAAERLRSRLPHRGQRPRRHSAPEVGAASTGRREEGRGQPPRLRRPRIQSAPAERPARALPVQPADSDRLRPWLR
eukprot:12223842-Alexandrium_andersonii.AAC.1